MRPLAGHPSVPAGPPHAIAASQHHPAHHGQQEYTGQHQHQHQHRAQHHSLPIHSNQQHPQHQGHHHRHSSFTQYPSTSATSSSYEQLLSPPTSVSSVSAFSPSSSPLDYPPRSTYPPHITDASFPRSIQRLGHGPETLVHQLGHRATPSHPHQERYSYIPPPSRRPLLLRDPHYHGQAHDQVHAEEKRGFYRPQQPVEHHSPSWRSPVDQSSQGVQPPPPIRTQLSGSSNNTSHGSSSFDCPPLSGLTISSSSSRSGPSPATPRSLLPHFGGSVLPYPIMDSPVDYRERIQTPTTHHGKTAMSSYPWGNDEDMDLREREQGHYRVMDRKDTSTSASASPASSRKPAKKESVERERHEVYGGAETSMAMSGDASISSSRKQSLSDSFVLEEDEDDFHLSQSAKKVKTSRKRAVPVTPRRTSLEDVLDEIEEEDNAATGNQSMTGHGLRIYAQRVCERVQATTDVVSVSRIVHELSGARGELVEGAPEAPGQENIRRRVYDALNVLEALGVISMNENKDFRWVGIQESRVVNDISRRIAAKTLAGGEDPPEEPEDEESEEPEDDDMEIEKLQREVDALNLGNALGRAQLKDQAAKHVQVLNLVERNKRREAKEQEKEERRKQRRAEKRAVRAQAASSGGDQDMTDVGPQGCSDDHSEVRLRAGSEPRRRRRSSRQPSQTPIGARDEDMENAAMMDTDTGDSEDAALRKEQEKRERKERRERKEKRAQKRQQKEAQKLQLPFVMVQMEGYAGQSSDSEGGITVVRRVRDEQRARSSGKSSRYYQGSEETTANIEISIPHQEEMSVISDTEVLTDLGLDSVPMEQLRAVFSAELIETVLLGVDIQSTGSVSLRGGHERALNRAT